jgi:hypothetical protein
MKKANRRVQTNALKSRFDIVPKQRVDEGQERVYAI